MSKLIVWVANGLPFAFLYAPSALANIAVFVFWVFWITALASVLFCIRRQIKINHNPMPWPLRFLDRLITWSGLIALVAYGHFVMAAVVLITLALLRFQKERQLAAEKAVGEA